MAYSDASRTSKSSGCGSATVKYSFNSTGVISNIERLPVPDKWILAELYYSQLAGLKDKPLGMLGIDQWRQDGFK